MKVLLLQVDGKIPNIALMRIAAHHRQLGDAVELRRGHTRFLYDAPDIVYASAIFERSRPLVERLRKDFPGAVVGGTGVSVEDSLEAHGISTTQQDYSIYPGYDKSIGFTQRGCRLRCAFCVVPMKEGAVRFEQTIGDIWRGDPWPRELLLLDNDFFGQPDWRVRIQEIRDGGFKVSFNQGINARFLTEEAAEAIASVDYRDDGMKQRRIYTAWDNRKDEERLFAGLRALVSAGVARSSILVYLLVGFWPGETHEDRDYRRRRLREFGALPYPMPYVRTRELVGFQRWCIRHFDLYVTWEDWAAADYMHSKLTRDPVPPLYDHQPISTDGY